MKTEKECLRKVAKFNGRLYGGGQVYAPTIQKSVKFRDFVELYLRSFPLKLGKLTNFKALFLTVSIHFAHWSLSKV